MSECEECGHFCDFCTNEVDGKGSLFERKRIIAKARERASRFPYFPHGDALRNFANELEAEDG